MKNILLLSLIAIVVFAACKKKNNEQSCETAYLEETAPDTVQPSVYLMTYPGSVWNYDDGSTETCDAWEAAGIVTVSELPNHCKTVTTTYTTAAHTSFGSILGDQLLLFHGNDQPTELQPLLATTVGTFYERQSSTSNSGTRTRRLKVVEILNDMTVSGVVYPDVVHVHERDSVFYPHVGNGPRFSIDYYYANGVGLIRKISDYTQASGTITELNLVSYEIGPH